jgi:quinol-cytochrome oxidoreductase complex cytochrome b subunit
MGATLKYENSFVRFVRWVYAGVDRTIFMGMKFTFPGRFVSPLGFLGMLTFVIFVILGITGALLMLWYEPILDRAWNSVQNINDTIPYGFHIRNIHYHASNAMVMMALLHMYYQYFSGRYKIRNEILWVTGIIIGVLTILEAFTGYDIIFSERAELAISIAASLTNSIPVLGPQMREAFFGAGFHDFILRFYTFHVFMLPIALLGLMVFHFPRLLIVPFIDRYKKFSWKDRPLITALGITSLAQIIVTTYWGFYIDPDRDKALLERLVIDPIFFYLVMILLVPLSFGFTYMMIKLAKHAEANAKLQPKKPSKGSINISQKWLYVLFVALLAFQVYLNISAYYAVLQGMKNYSLFIIGIMMLVFAAMFHIYRYGRALAKAPPPKPVPPTPSKPAAAPKPVPATTTVEKPLATPPTVAAKSSSDQKGQQMSSQQQQKQSTTGQGVTGTTAQAADRTQTMSTSSSIEEPDKRAL